MGWVYGTPEEMLSETFPCPAAEEGPHWSLRFPQNLLVTWQLSGDMGKLVLNLPIRGELGHGLTFADPQPSISHR